QKLTLEALQELRIKHRWEAMDKENQAVLQAKSENKTYNPPILNNGDTVKLLLVRSRYLLYKPREKWTKNQEERAEILFKLYPDIKTAYSLSAQLRTIYNSKNDKNSRSEEHTSELQSRENLVCRLLLEKKKKK